MSQHVEIRASTNDQEPLGTSTGVKTRLVDTSGNYIAWGYTPLEITTKTTTLVKSGAGQVGSIVINKTGSVDVVTVYDALTATGTPIATITAPTLGMKFLEGVNFTVGLCIVTSGTTAGNYGVHYA